jgi:hypothetical protein
VKTTEEGWRNEKLDTRIENLDRRRRVLTGVVVERRLEDELGRGQVQGLDENTSKQAASKSGVLR